MTATEDRMYKAILPTSDGDLSASAAAKHAASVADQMVAERDARIEALEAALQEIVNPLKFLQGRAEARGDRLSTFAYVIANSAPHLQGIARAALAATAEGGES